MKEWPRETVELTQEQIASWPQNGIHCLALLIQVSVLSHRLQSSWGRASSRGAWNQRMEKVQPERRVLGRRMQSFLSQVGDGEVATWT